MLEPTRKHLTKVELRFVGPASRKVEAIKALHALGFLNAINRSEAIPWRECFPEIEGNEPGIYLAGARHSRTSTASVTCSTSPKGNSERLAGCRYIRLHRRCLSSMSSADFESVHGRRTRRCSLICGLAACVTAQSITPSDNCLKSAASFTTNILVHVSMT